MKHLKKRRTLGRDSAQRKALLSGLAGSLFLHKRIQTTLAKAKEVTKFAEKLISKAKIKSVATIRSVNKVLSPAASRELFDVVAPKSLERRGGYTRIIKVGQRKSDAAPMAFLELVDFPKEVSKKDTRKAEEETKVADAKEKKEETKKEEGEDKTKSEEKKDK